MLATFFLVFPSVLTGPQHPARAAQTTCALPVTLTNGDFEAPVIRTAATMELIKEGAMPGWLTTAPDDEFELWREVRQNFNAASGRQFVELNANYVSELYQDLPTTPGLTLRWELRHRGRLGPGNDVMAVRIGPPPTAPSTTFVPNQSTPVADPPAAWGSWSGTYTVPAGQTTTRFGFESVSTAQNKPTHGNFLDGISFGTAACLETSTAVSGTSANVGELLTYTVNTQNKGGNPAKNAVMADDLPANVTFVPGSIRSISGATSTPVSDAADSDIGEYDAATRSVRVRTGTGAGAATGGTIPVGESRSFSYQVRVNPAAATTTITNDATVSFRDDLGNTTRTSVSSDVSTAVAAAADLVITAVVAAPGVIAGQTATTDITIVNNGPNAAGSVVASAVVPAGISGITASSNPGGCSVTLSVATCNLGTLPPGTPATMTVSGTVIAQATPGAQATLTASVTSSTYEISQADNATSVSATVVTLTDLDVVLTYSPATPVQGDTVTYRAVVTNNGPSRALAVTLTNPVTTGSTYLSSNPAGSGACAYVGVPIRTLTCTWPTLDPGQTTSVDILVQLDDADTDSIHNAVSVSSSTPESDVTDNNAAVKAPSLKQADLSVQLTLDASTAKPGAEVPFTLTVRNRGPSSARNVSFNTVVPPGFTIVRDPSPICTSTACTIQELPSGVTRLIRGKAVVGLTAAAGVQQASTTIISSTVDPAPGDETSVVTFTIELEADLRVSQDLSNSTTPANPLVAGENVLGVVTVDNDGPTRAEGVVLRQAIPAGRPVPTATPSAGSCAFQGTVDLGGMTPDGGAYVCNLASLAGGSSWRINFAGVLLSPGYTGAVYARTATVSASSPDPDSSDNTVVTTRDVERRSDLRVTKTATPTSLVQSGTVQFDVTVRNHGPSDAVGVLLREEPQSGLVLLTAGTPSAGAFDMATLIWSIPSLTVADGPQTLTVSGVARDSGTLVGWTRVTASGSTDPAPANNAASATVTATAAAPALSVSVLTTLSPASTIGAAVNTSIGYVYRVTNTGNLALSQLTAVGTRGVPGSCLSTTLAPGDTTDCAAGSYPVTSADITAGVPIGNTVTVMAASAIDTGPVQYAQVTANVPVVVARPALAAVVTPRVSTPSRLHAVAAGDTIEYDYQVTNNGNVHMVDIALADTRTGPVTCPASTLDIGLSMTCHTQAGAGYTVLPSDLDAGLPITDAVSVTARPTGVTGLAPYGTYQASVTVAPPNPALTLTVDSTVPVPVTAGDGITYRYRLSNTGNVTVNNVEVSDTKVTGDNCPATIAAGATVTCYSAPAQPYRVTQDDVDAGHPVENDAMVTGQGATPGSAAVAAEGGTSLAVDPSRPALSITATVMVIPPDHATGVARGDRIDVAYRVRNTGNVTMREVTVVDTLAGSATCPNTAVLVNTEMVCASTPYTVNQGDVDRGGTLDSTARVRGRSPGQASAVPYASVPVSVPLAVGSPGLTLDARALVSPADHRTAVDEGDEIDYEYVVANAGAVTIRQIAVTDSLFGPADCPGTALGPGESVTCASPRPYTVTRADVDTGGEITNRVSMSGRTPDGRDLSYAPVMVGINLLVPEPALRAQITPVVTPPAHRNAVEAGDTITYRYEVANTGNQVMSGISVTSSRGSTVRCPATALTVRSSMICTGDAHIVTQEEIDAATPITEEIFVAGTPPGSGGAQRFGPFTVDVGVVEARPTLTLEMSIGVTTAAVSPAVRAGDVIRYRYEVRNTGNVTVRNVTVDDPRAGAVTCEDTRLAVGAGTGCTAEEPYRVTQDDVDAGRAIVARAYARGVWSGTDRAVSSGPAQVSVPVAAPSPRLAAAQKAAWTDTDGDGKLSIRDDVVSTVVVTNTGNVTLVNIRVTGLPAAVTCAKTAVAPGASVTCVSGVYHLSAAEIASGKHTYEAHVTGDMTVADSPGAEARAPSTVVIPAEPSRGSPPPRTVPVTGPPVVSYLMTALVLIVGGLALLLLTEQPPGRHAGRPGRHARPAR